MTLLHQVAVITGAIAGIGLLLVVRAMWPRHPHLGSTVQALTAATPHAKAVPPTGRGWRVRLGSAVLRRWPTLPGVRIPYRNLALIVCR